MASRIRRTLRSASLELSGVEVLRVEADVVTGELAGEPPHATIEVVADEPADRAPPALPSSTRSRRPRQRRTRR